MEATTERTTTEKYTAHKDSGVEWLGEVPAHWECTRLGTRFTERRTKVSDKDFAPLSVTKQGILPQLDSAAKTNDGDNRKLVKEGDFVINSRSDRKGSSGISPFDGSVSLINIVVEPIDIHPSYCNYLLKGHAFIEEFYRMGHGIVADLWTTRYDEMKAITIAIPPPKEQSAIAAFLDHKTAGIDKAIAQKEALIGLLKERRQIFIHKAVTRGLDAAVPMKDSGVEWIGEIPAHWEVKRLKHIANLIGDKVSSKNIPLKYVGLENIESWSGNYVSSETEVEGIAARFKKGDILFGKLRPYLAKVYLAKTEGVCSTELLVYRCETNFDKNYLQALMLSSGFISLIDSSTYGSKMPRANSDFIGNQFIPVPPEHEQVSICNFLNEAAQKIVIAKSFLEKEIAALKEFKSTLINAAVTGKIKVV